MVSIADGHAEREATSKARDDETVSITLGAGKGYDAREFIQARPEYGALAENTGGHANDARTLSEAWPE